MNALRIYDICNPVDGLGYAMIDPRLTWLRARVTCGDDADEIPSTSFLQHQRTSAITLTRILTAATVTSAHHLVINDDVDAIGPMPSLAEAIIDHGHVYSLQRLGPQSGT